MQNEQFKKVVGDIGNILLCLVYDLTHLHTPGRLNKFAGPVLDFKAV